jgi:hypothetical protein
MTKESKTTGSLSLERMLRLGISQDSLTLKPDPPTVFESQIVQRVAIISRHYGCFLYQTKELIPLDFAPLLHLGQDYVRTPRHVEE